MGKKLLSLDGYKYLLMHEGDGTIPREYTLAMLMHGYVWYGDKAEGRRQITKKGKQAIERYEAARGDDVAAPDITWRDVKSLANINSVAEPDDWWDKMELLGYTQMRSIFGYSLTRKGQAVSDRYEAYKAKKRAAKKGDTPKPKQVEPLFDIINNHQPSNKFKVDGSFTADGVVEFFAPKSIGDIFGYKVSSAGSGRDDNAIDWLLEMGVELCLDDEKVIYTAGEYIISGAKVRFPEGTNLVYKETHHNYESSEGPLTGEAIGEGDQCYIAKDGKLHVYYSGVADADPDSEFEAEPTSTEAKPHAAKFTSYKVYRHESIRGMAPNQFIRKGQETVWLIKTKTLSEAIAQVLDLILNYGDANSYVFVGVDDKGGYQILGAGSNFIINTVKGMVSE